MQLKLHQVKVQETKKDEIKLRTDADQHSNKTYDKVKSTPSFQLFFEPGCRKEVRIIGDRLTMVMN